MGSMKLTVPALAAGFLLTSCGPDLKEATFTGNNPPQTPFYQPKVALPARLTKLSQSWLSPEDYLSPVENDAGLSGQDAFALYISDSRTPLLSRAVPTPLKYNGVDKDKDKDGFLGWLPVRPFTPTPGWKGETVDTISSLPIKTIRFNDGSGSSVVSKDFILGSASNDDMLRDGMIVSIAPEKNFMSLRSTDGISGLGEYRATNSRTTVPVLYDSSSGDLEMLPKPPIKEALSFVPLAVAQDFVTPDIFECLVVGAARNAQGHAIEGLLWIPGKSEVSTLSTLRFQGNVATALKPGWNIVAADTIDSEEWGYDDERRRLQVQVKIKDPENRIRYGFIVMDLNRDGYVPITRRPQKQQG